MNGTSAPRNGNADADASGADAGPRHSSPAWFFARTLEARDVTSLWLADRVTVLHGPAGVGKTSLLRSGVMELADRQTGVDVLPLADFRAPGHAPGSATGRYGALVLSQWLPAAPAGLDATVAGALLSRPQRVSAHGEPYSVLAVIDQFEEAFAPSATRQREPGDIIDELASALLQIPALKLLLVIRDDYLATLSSYERRLSPYPLSYVQLDAPSPSMAADVVRQFFGRAGCSLGTGLPEDIVDQLRTVRYTDLLGDSLDLKQGRVAPFLLRVACTELLSALPADVEALTSEDLESLGGINAPLAHFYDRAVHEVEQETGEVAADIRAWIESAFITEHGTPGSVSRGVIMAAGMPNRVADAFARRSILSSEYRAHCAWYGISEDRMIAPIREANRAWRNDRGIVIGPRVSSEVASAFTAAAEDGLADGNLPDAQRFASAAVAGYRELRDERRMANGLVLQGNIARAEGDLEQAEEQLRAALSTFASLADRNSTVRTLSALADIRFMAGDYVSAAEFQREAVGHLPAEVDALIGLGYALWYGGSPADAEATFTQALASNPVAARAYGGRGQVRAEMREFAAALADLDRALALGLPRAEEIDARTARALAVAGQGHGERAARDLAAALDLDPSRARSLLRAARLSGMLGQPEEAITGIERALRCDPPLPPRDQAMARRLLARLRSELP